MISGTIDTNDIYNTHVKIREMVASYKEINKSIAEITAAVNENWVGRGHDAFESQYELLICRIDDFGDTLQDIYDALVEAEASYEDQDDSLRQEFVMAMS